VERFFAIFGCPDSFPFTEILLGKRLRKTKKIKRNLEVLAIDTLTQFARTLPRGLGLKVFSVIGMTASRVFRHDRERALTNLSMAFPDTPPAIRDALAAAMFKTLGKNFFEFLNLEGSSTERLTGLVQRVEGERYLDEAIGLKNGLIAITGHIGCFELLAAYFAKRGYPLYVIGRELWEKRINERLLRIRESVGYHTIDRDTGAKEVIRVLKDKKIVAALIDQHTRVSGIYVPFFNRPAHTPTGVAKLALATGAPILPMAIYMKHNGKHEIRILPKIEFPENGGEKDERIGELTRRCSSALEELVRYDPTQWVWFHDRWPESAHGENDDSIH
jgi:KDO2-lipid IV(A) lauroyltransferase